MASKKGAGQLVMFCRVFQWVKTKDAALAGAITDLCMEGALAGGRSGVTFLYPGAAARKEIREKAYTEEAGEAIRLLEAHIIQGAVHTAADFQAGVGSRLGVLLEVEGPAVGDEVTLKGGARLKVAADFRPLRRDNLAVWEVAAGAVPLEGPEFTPPRRGRGAPAAKVGGGAGAGAAAGAGRWALANAVEVDFDRCMAADGCRTREPYLACAVSLLNFLKDAHPALFAAALPLVDRDPAVTFYLLAEPYKTAGAHLLPDAVLFGPAGWNRAEIFVNAVSEFRAFVDAAAAAAPGSVRQAVDGVRLQILGEDGRLGNKVETPKRVREAYAAMVASNAVGGVGPVLPAATLELFAGDGGAKKLWQDELRFLLHAALARLRALPAYDSGEFAGVVGMLRDGRPGDDYLREAALSDAQLLGQNVAPRAEFMLLVQFINSTDFLYKAVAAGEVSDVATWGEIPTTPTLANPRDLSIYNSELCKATHLERLAAAGLDAPRVMSAGEAVQHRHHASAAAAGAALAQ